MSASREKVKRRVLESDVKNYLCGEEPSAVELATAPVLDIWSTRVARLNAGWKMHLRGEVRGHPKLPDGAPIETSEVVWLDRKHQWCRTRNRVYRLDGAEITNDGIVD